MKIKITKNSGLPKFAPLVTQNFEDQMPESRKIKYQFYETIHFFWAPFINVQFMKSIISHI